MKVFTEEEADYINYDPKSGNMYEGPKYFMAICYITLSWWSSQDVFELITSMMHDEGIDIDPSANISIYVSLPSPLPIGDRYIYAAILEEIKKKGKLYEAIKEFIIREKEIITLDNKIKCLFSSKRFYPDTLKKEFPEAYQVYVKTFVEENADGDSNKEQSSCDTIESIRATLSSNK